ncbi:MAG: type I restriction enzyme HsdR N-terminal domain-containing protein [Bacteroidia bacterium]|nr:type I restriction enzyme HsdR N-terminal domain-containing protein [Bacteroidia bacterium]
MESSLIYPTFNVRIKHENNKAFVFDEIRKKWILLTPEEWVRQHLLNYLITQKNVPASLISVEKEIDLNNTRKRYDAVVYNKTMSPVLLIECKAPDVSITETTLEQTLRYNLILGVNFLLMTNGLKQFVIQIEKGKAKLISDLPNYNELIV